MAPMESALHNLLKLSTILHEQSHHSDQLREVNTCIEAALTVLSSAAKRPKVVLDASTSEALLLDYSTYEMVIIYLPSNPDNYDIIRIADISSCCIDNKTKVVYTRNIKHSLNELHEKVELDVANQVYIFKFLDDNWYLQRN